MKTVFAVIPLLALISGVLLYKQTGKKEILRFDMVNFFYAFILMPTVYIWFKSLLFLLLRSELGIIISQSELFIWDTVYSIVFMFIFASVVIHSLTKSFELNIKKDPLYDLFEHSEYFHLWLSHIIFFGGGMIFITLLSIINVWFDLSIFISKFNFYLLLLTSPITSIFIFKMFEYSALDEKFTFLKLMKFIIGICFFIYALVYIVFEPIFASEKIVYWYMTNVFGFLALISLIHTSEPGPIPVHKRIGRKALWFVRKIKSTTK
ncbi:MAG: hypothetical protein HN981_00875 [Candidatus Pacebacteria bacterium]|mgnify:FL=1|jgi:hypothetical protein|nr:hypothetical protein [Candidatus Paceibacterota bacterium]MBT6756593.1 hypothetical protein [Candidatus Paceibacterota bacterium]MBT6920932.1 hypothetical protein [Candidatus Paceibacterota bacterium]